MPVIVDSSGWIEYFIDGANAKRFAEAIEKESEVFIPTVILMEVYKWILRESSENDALTALATMRQYRLLDLDSHLAISAAENSHRLKLSLADSIIYTTARAYQSELWTQDADMEDLDGVIYLQHQNRK